MILSYRSPKKYSNVAFDNFKRQYTQKMKKLQNQDIFPVKQKLVEFSQKDLDSFHDDNLVS